MLKSTRYVIYSRCGDNLLDLRLVVMIVHHHRHRHSYPASSSQSPDITWQRQEKKAKVETLVMV